MKKSDSFHNHQITKSRIVKITVAFSMAAVFLIYNLFSLQLINYGYYQDKVYDQITTSSALKAERGKIYDRNMNLLATDKTVWRIFVSSRDIKKFEKEHKVLNEGRLQLFTAGNLDSSAADITPVDVNI